MRVLYSILGVMLALSALITLIVGALVLRDLTDVSDVRLWFSVMMSIVVLTLAIRLIEKKIEKTPNLVFHYMQGAAPVKRATAKSGGYDIYAHWDMHGQVIYPGDTIKVKTGVLADIPKGHELWVVPRSGLALHAGITVLNAPGVVDEDYTGEICVILHRVWNDEEQAPYEIGTDAIAQIVLVKKPEHTTDTADLRDGIRGAGGFGSTNND